MIRSFDGLVPQIAESAYVDERATVIGDVLIEADASVWPGVVLRGDRGRIVVREGANVQDNATVHEGSEIGPSATVGHNAIVHAATVGPRSVIGMGAIVLDRAEVGKESLVAANSIVVEDTAIPDSVVAMGVPAEVRTEVEDSPWTAAGEHYVELARRHAETSEVLEREEVTFEE